ncbi:CGL128 [Auxenochlorella protothecoides x Auxenochlorella symbiontica]
MGPRRTTLTYSSEDAAPLGDAQVFVYYCKYSGKHVLTTDCDLSKAPRRQTDHALVIDTTRHTVRLYNTTDAGEKLIRRRSGAVERQLRMRVGKLPFAYWTEPEGKLLYIMDSAVTTYSTADDPSGSGVTVPVPPCIRALDAAGGATAVTLEVDDRARATGILKVSADAVRLQLKTSIIAEGAAEELLEYLRSILGTRLSQLSLERGEATRKPTLRITGLGPAAVYAKLAAALQAQAAALDAVPA